MKKQNKPITTDATDYDAQYLRNVLRERERAWHASLFALRDAGWNRAEILAGVAAIDGLVRLPHVSANEIAADLLVRADSVVTIDSRVWKRRVAQVRCSQELALALVLLRRELERTVSA